MPERDLFISYASEDKDAIAQPLADALRLQGITVWFDDYELTLGDSLRQTIDRGLANSRFGVVILSSFFFAKEWTRRELDGLSARETLGDGKVILPVWHGIDAAYVRQFSPLLADKIAVKSDVGVDEIIKQIKRALEHRPLPDNPDQRVNRPHLGDPPASVNSPVAITMPGDRSTPFVDRGADLRWMEELWEGACRGRRQVGMLRGDAGIGKTRLVDQWRSGAERTGRMLYGRSSEPGLFQPFAGALSFIGGLPAEAQRWIVGERGPHIKRLVPALPYEAPRAGERGIDLYLLRDATCDVLARLAEARPTALVLDDAYMMGEDALDLLRHILAALDDAALLVLLVTRTHGGEEFELAAEQLRRNHIIHERHVYPLDDEFAREIIVERTGVEPGTGLLRRGQGNPRQLEDISVAPPDARSPERAIVSDLDPSARLLVELAALGPSTISTETLARAAELPIEAAAVALGQLAERLLLERMPAPDGDPASVSWRFTHQERRRVVLELLDPARKREHARRLTPVLEAGSTVDSERLAGLYEIVGDRPGARRHASAAASSARKALAYDAAAQQYRRALANTDESPATARERCKLYIEIGHSLWNSGRFRDARAAYREAATLAMAEHHTPELVEAALGRAGRTGFEGPTGDAELVATLRAALERLGKDDLRLRARVLAATAHAIMFSGESTKEASAFGEQAISLARELNDARLLAEVLCTTSWTMWDPRDFRTRAATALEAVNLADSLPDVGDAVLQIESRVFRATTCFESGDTETARRDFDAISKLARSVNSPYYLAVAATGQATLSLLAGSESGEPAWRHALDIAQREHNPAVLRVIAVQIFYTRLLQGRLEEVRTSTQSLVDYDTWIPAWRSGLAVIYAEIGRLADARAVFERAARDAFGDVARDMFWYVTLDNYARVCVALGDRERAATLARLLGPFEERFVVAAGAGAIHGPVAFNLGRLAELRGDSDEAARLLLRAHELATRARCRTAAAEATVEYAALLLTRSPDEPLENEILGPIRAAVEEVEAIRSRKLALRMSELIDAATARAVGHQDSTSEATLTMLAGRLTPIAESEEPPRHKQLQLRMLRTGRAVIDRAAGRLDDKKLERHLASPRGQRIVTSAMERFFQPAVAHPFRGTLVLQMTLSDPDAAPIVWSFDIQRARATHLAIKPAEPDLVVTLPAVKFVDLLTGKANGVGEWFEGRINVQGDPIVAGRLVEMFGGAAPFHGLPVS